MNMTITMKTTMEMMTTIEMMTYSRCRWFNWFVRRRRLIKSIATRNNIAHISIPVTQTLVGLSDWGPVIMIATVLDTRTRSNYRHHSSRVQNIIFVLQSIKHSLIDLRDGNDIDIMIAWMPMTCISFSRFRLSRHIDVITTVNERLDDSTTVQVSNPYHDITRHVQQFSAE